MVNAMPWDGGELGCTYTGRLHPEGDGIEKGMEICHLGI